MILFFCRVKFNNRFSLAEILIDDLIQEIDNFRRLHQAPDVKLSVTLSQVANQWANKIANEGVERIDPNSNYGQLVCSHNVGGNTAKACVVKWYGAIRFFDWSNPKLTKNASPFTQLVWKNNSAIGVGVARGGGGIKKQNVGGKNFIVVLFEPGQNDAGDIKDNVRAATGELDLINYTVFVYFRKVNNRLRPVLRKISI